ncbi:MAG: triose-phosphate isomerase [Candidatus Omnitrophica bacterium CG1_02_49_10]|nr:MAG: triose-phosphate isomerase [Candidatus Omnitrophica bacterium CG1_02_49_10]
MRRPIIAGNWKLNKTITEAIDLANGLKRQLYDELWCDIVLCPPFTTLSEICEVLEGSNISLGAQDLFWQASGAYTGEISAPLLKDAGCAYVIIGHSERRQYFHETDEAVNKKLKSALEFGLTPIVCVGELLEERDAGRTNEVVAAQIKGSLAGLTPEDMEKIVIAYEPIWAIGTGRTATPQQAEEVHKFIRGVVAGIFSNETSDAVRIQYGGSVKADNISELMKEPDIDGALVGGASLSVESFAQIVKNAKGDK